MVINRPFWQKAIEDAWLQKNIIWLMGARSVGKASLCQSLENVEYFDCERPRVRQLRSINYWRDKAGHEVDFVLRNRTDNSTTVIECKFSVLSKDLNQSMLSSIGKNIEAFRKLYPDGKNIVVASDVEKLFERQYKDINIHEFVGVRDLVSILS